MLNTKTYTAPSTTIEEIQVLLAKWREAVENKDIDSLLTLYADDVLSFDVCPPYKTQGKEGIGQAWKGCLPHFPDTFQSEHRDIMIYSDGEIAFVSGVHHFVPEPADHPCGLTWSRMTLGLKRTNGGWRIVHEHASIPFNPMTNQAWFIKDPDVLDHPDYGANENCMGDIS